jgi:hypothetical protein
MVCRKGSPNLAVLLKGCFVKVYYMSNALNSFVSYLARGNSVTSRQVRAMFKVDNAADLAYRARNEGISVYTNRTTLSDGTKTYTYRLGNPSTQFEKYLDQGQVARARKTLYRDAISVTMNG